MTIIPASVTAIAAAPLPVTPASPNKAAAIASAAQHLLLHLERGQCVDAPILRTAMENAFGASDADGGWDWKTAYDACEAVTIRRVLDKTGGDLSELLPDSRGPLRLRGLVER